MTEFDKPALSVVVPVFNESTGLADFNKRLISVLDELKDTYEVIYVDDGSSDDGANKIRAWSKSNHRIRLVKLTRNFGKEIATTAGIHEARGQAVITIDADGQHPVELIPQFVLKWRAGSRVVIGLRQSNQKAPLLKRVGSRLFYKFFNRFSNLRLVPGSTDFRLIDRRVQQEFIKMTERNRITRGLIDWLGYDQDYVEFKASPRLAGEAGYSLKKLAKLALDSIISMSLSPLYISAYIGAFILPVSSILGVLMIINVVAGDPINLHATGSAYLMVLILFLVGILLVSQGIIGLYLSHIHTETKNRPLYVIDREGSTREQD